MHHSPHNVIVPQFDSPFDATVHYLVEDLRADLAAISDHQDRRGRVYPLVQSAGHSCAGRRR